MKRIDIFTILHTIVWLIGINVVVQILGFNVYDFRFWITLGISVIFQLLTLVYGMKIIERGVVS